jgi:hypothetical protein
MNALIDFAMDVVRRIMVRHPRFLDRVRPHAYTTPSGPLGIILGDPTPPTGAICYRFTFPAHPDAYVDHLGDLDVCIGWKGRIATGFTFSKTVSREGRLSYEAVVSTVPWV